MRMIRYGGGWAGWGSLDAGAMSAHILSRADSGSTAFDAVSPSPPFSSVVSTVEGGWEVARLHSTAYVRFFRIWSRPRAWFGVKQGRPAPGPSSTALLIFSSTEPDLWMAPAQATNADIAPEKPSNTARRCRGKSAQGLITTDQRRRPGQRGGLRSTWRQETSRRNRGCRKSCAVVGAGVGRFHSAGMISAGMISTGTIAGKEMTGWNDPCEMTRESER